MSSCPFPPPLLSSSSLGSDWALRVRIRVGVRAERRSWSLETWVVLVDVVLISQVTENGLTGSIMTFYEVTDGDMSFTTGTSHFHSHFRLPIPTPIFNPSLLSGKPCHVSSWALRSWYHRQRLKLKTHGMAGIVDDDADPG